MPLKLRAPRAGKTPYYTARGTYLGIKLERSTGTAEKRIAQAVLKKWKTQIEAGEYDQPVQSGPMTFVTAAVAYMKAGGERAFVAPILDVLGDTPAETIDQVLLDTTASTIYPDATPATLNRQFYTPVSAILKRAGFDWEVKRPIGWRGRVVRQWLWPEQAWRILDTAKEIDKELWILCVMLLFGGLRISEQLAMTCNDLRPTEAFAYVPDSKNGEPQPMHLTAFMLEALEQHPRGLERPGERLFRFHKGGGLDFMLIQACALASGIEKPKRAGRGSKWPKLPPYEFDWVSWHTFRRTYATWLRRYAGFDDKDLLDTGRWKSLESASRYAQTVVHETATKSDLLPVPATIIRGLLGASSTKAS